MCVLQFYLAISSLLRVSKIIILPIKSRAVLTPSENGYADTVKEGRSRIKHEDFGRSQYSSNTPKVLSNYLLLFPVICNVFSTLLIVKLNDILI